MRGFKITILLILGAGIFGTSGYFAYELFIKPGRDERREKHPTAPGAPKAIPSPDPGEPEFRRLKSLQDSGNLPDARDGWVVWINAHPDSPFLAQARRNLGDANMSLLFRSVSGSAAYTVVKGDSLVKIAAKQHSSAELIQKANNLPGINLQIGQQLLIPVLKISMELHRNDKRLILLNNGSFLKEYALLSAPATSGEKIGSLNSKVLEKTALIGAKRIPFGDKSYLHSEKSILLSQSPPIVGISPRGTPSAAPAPAGVGAGTSGNTAPTPEPLPPLPGGFVLEAGDLQEIFPLVSRNTPVTIR